MGGQSVVAWLALTLAVGGCHSSDTQTPGDGSTGRGDAAVDAMVQPITFVQAYATSAGPSSEFSLDFPQPVRAGDLLVVGFDYDSATPLVPVQIVDGHGGANFHLSGPYDNGTNHQYLAYGIARTAGGDGVTVALNGMPNTELEVSVHEYSGSWTTDPLDHVVGGTGASLAVDGADTPNITTTTSGELLFGFFTFGGGGGGGIEGTGFIRRTSFANNVTEDRITGGSGDYRGVATMQSGTAWTGIAAAFINGQ